MKSLLTLLFTFPCVLIAAPIPATSSSMLLSKNNGIYISKHDFKIHADNTLWENIGSPIENSNILTLFKEPKNSKNFRASLSVRTDKIFENISVKKYMNRWKKDYLRFGFSILRHKKVKIGQNKAFLLDLVNSNSDKQLRQVVFLKNKRAVILTCRGLKSNFSSIVKSCNSIFKNFSWL